MGQNGYLMKPILLLCLFILVVPTAGCSGRDAGETIAGGVCEQLSGSERGGHTNRIGNLACGSGSPAPGPARKTG
jgi:hypothetical protein